MNQLAYDWADLAFGSKKPLNDLRAVFIAAPRSMSATRFTQLVKAYLPLGNIILGLAKEPYVVGLEGQPQFTTLASSTVQHIIDKVSAAPQKNKIYTLAYFQRETTYILEKLHFQKVLFVNGSWKYPFHTLAPFYTLTKNHVPYQLISPFTSENEARAYAETILPPEEMPTELFTAQQMLQLAENVAKRSFDNGFQTGITLGRKKGAKYQFLQQGFNRVVPHQGYALHYGASRETNFSPTNDLNHYDAIHAEVDLMVRVQKQKLDLNGTTLFINLLPCPSCARMFTQTDITEFVYQQDHSDGYGVKMIELAGKKVTRIVG